MKRVISLLLTVIMLLSAMMSLAACSFIDMLGKDPADGSDEEPPVTNDGEPTINGTPLSDFTIVYDESSLDYNKRAAEYIRDRAAEKFGIELDIIDDDDEGSRHEIVVGETSRGISAELEADCEGLEFAILAQDGSVALEGELFVIAAAAYYFMETYAKESGYEATVPETVSVHEPIVKKAKNFIMLIGDGMGEYQTKLFDYMENDCEYGDGEDIFYGYMLPYTGWSRTNSLSGTTDSAAGATALACGYKTYNEYVGLGKDKNELKSLTELASELGKATAVMSTETKTGATPASFSAHADSRNNESAIIDSQARTTATYGTIIDCGYDYYTASYMKVIEKHITDTLDAVSEDKDGFFLMYEEAYVDKHCHNNEIDNAFLALIRFNQAIARFMEYAFYNPDTLILITADHETGGLQPNANGELAYSSGNHTSSDVPIFAYGRGADFFDGASIENIEIAHFFGVLMGVDDFGDPSLYQDGK